MLITAIYKINNMRHITNLAATFSKNNMRQFYFIQKRVIYIFIAINKKLTSQTATNFIV